MKKLAGLCLGMSVGATLMYLFDPSTGNRRRSVMKDKLAHYRHQLREGARATSSDVSHRARGWWAGLLSVCAAEEDVSDDVLESRVRSRLGRSVSHPSWIRIEADQGQVSVTGHVPNRDREKLHRTVASIRGVRHVDERDLVVDPDDRVPYTAVELRRSHGHWKPAERLCAVLTGLSLGVAGMANGRFAGKLAALTGLGLCLRGLTNVRLSDMPAEAARHAPRMT
ncbi:MAG: BON domain-containing protein [Candidatus Polarisedimenticolia bacterium]